MECNIEKKVCHGVKQYAKICAIGEQNGINILGGQKIEGMVEREKRED